MKITNSVADTEISSLKAALVAESRASALNAQIASELDLFREGLALKVVEKFPNGIKDKLFWVITNWKAVLELIRFVIEEAKAVKQRIDELIKQHA